MRQVGILIAIYVGMLVGMSAHAEQRRLVIPYNDMVFQGQNKLMLKQEIKRHYPRLNLRQADLVRVRLVAKSSQLKNPSLSISISAGEMLPNIRASGSNESGIPSLSLPGTVSEQSLSIPSQPSD